MKVILIKTMKWLWHFLCLRSLIFSSIWRSSERPFALGTENRKLEKTDEVRWSCCRDFSTVALKTNFAFPISICERIWTLSPLVFVLDLSYMSRFTTPSKLFLFCHIISTNSKNATKISTALFLYLFIQIKVKSHKLHSFWLSLPYPHYLSFHFPVKALRQFHKQVVPFLLMELVE